ncbi:hypothetical protein LCGC14_0477820 [marine sediment metagenome]|uniref:Uncharacterized protein n=1 Tax=marine sediment metagenome TaxID=412755 RepID=A0A0F9UXD8_9ZZZZ
MKERISNLNLLKHFEVKHIEKGVYKEGFLAGLRLATNFKKYGRCFCKGSSIFRPICYECQEWLKQNIEKFNNKLRNKLYNLETIKEIDASVVSYEIEELKKEQKG